MKNLLIPVDGSKESEGVLPIALTLALGWYRRCHCPSDS